MSPSPESTYGPLLLGSLFASFLSGFTTLQAFLYFRLSSQDPTYLKIIVAFVWFLDLLHTAFTWDVVWFYMVKNFGDESKIDVINHCMFGAGITTAAVTFIAQCFYVHRIFLLSKRKYWLATPIFFVVFARICCAFVALAIMLQFMTFPPLFLQFSWVLTPSLSVSCAADVLIALSMFVLLQMNRTKSRTLNHLIDLLVIYAFEMGILTGCAAVVAMLCWVVVPNKLVFLGLYFPIGKLYANSLLGSLNARHHLQNIRKPIVSQNGMTFWAASFASTDTNNTTDNTFKQGVTIGYNAQPLEVSVQHDVHYDNSNSSPKSDV